MIALSELLDIRLFFWFVLPILITLATLYDQQPKRSMVWFWGGSSIIIASLFWLAG